MAVTETSYGYDVTNVAGNATITTALVKIKQIQLIPTAVGDNCTITDTAGNKLASLLATATSSTVEIYMADSWITGLKLSVFSNTSATICIMKA